MSAPRGRRGGTPVGVFETRPWGGFQTVEEGRGYKVKRLLVRPGQRLSLQRHRFRAEHWVVVTGAPRVFNGKVIIGNEPNQPRFWQPQFNLDGSPASPAAYESLLARSYDALKGVDPSPWDSEMYNIADWTK